MYKIMKTLVKGLCCHFIYRVRYIGLEKIDNKKKYIICPNHSNVLDPTFIFPIVDNLSIMAKSEIFKNKLLAKLFRRYRVFPVNREKRDVKSTLHAIECLNLEENSKLLMFPEGGILKKKEELRKKVQNGAVYFAAVGGAGALLSKCIKEAEVIAYDDLGTEAIRKLRVENFPVIVVIDSQGNNLYETAVENFKKLK